MMATATQTEVQKLYVAYFTRPADVAGLAYWANILTNAPNGYQVISSHFAESAEYQATYAGMDNRSTVNAVYQHLFGRAAETAGVDYWANLLDRHAITIDNVVTQIAAGAQGTDKVAYNGKVSVAAAFTDHMDLAVEQQAYGTAAGMKIAQDYIASVHDLASGAAAIDPGNIDYTISAMVKGGYGLENPTPLVGMADPLPPMHV
jgi:hypothetical protein